MKIHIEEIFVSALLKEGGSIVFMSLQYPCSEFITESIKNITGLNLRDYEDKNFISANLVKPEIWDKALNIATSKLKQKGPEILIFGSVLNSSKVQFPILLKILNHIKKITDHSKRIVMPAI